MCVCVFAEKEWLSNCPFCLGQHLQIQNSESAPLFSLPLKSNPPVLPITGWFVCICNMVCVWVVCMDEKKKILHPNILLSLLVKRAINSWSFDYFTLLYSCFHTLHNVMEGVTSAAQIWMEWKSNQQSQHLAILIGDLAWSSFIAYEIHSSNPLHIVGESLNVNLFFFFNRCKMLNLH